MKELTNFAKSSVLDVWLGLKTPLKRNKLFYTMVDPTKGIYALFTAGTIVRDSYPRKSPTRREQSLNLRRIWVQTLLDEAAL